MKVLSFINHKGGTAKTTSTLNVGAILAKKGYKTLLIDLDSQANLTEGVGVYNPDLTLYDTYKKRIPVPVVSVEDNLDVIPTSLDLAYFETEVINEQYREKVLKKMLGPIIETYDYVLIDCSPSLNILVINALEITDYVFIPVEAEYYAYRGLERILGILQNVQENSNSKLDLGGIFLTKYNSTRSISSEIKEQIKTQYATNLMDSMIRISVKATESQIEGKPLIYFSEDSPITKDYIALTDEILKRI